MKSRLTKKFVTVFIVTLIMTGIASIISGCTLTANTSTPDQVSIDVSYDDFIGNNHVTMEAEVTVGDTLVVTLFSNPTTGFQWSESAQISDQTILKQAEHKFEEPQAKGIVGAGGKEVWTFTALKKGTTEITMEYSRPWEGGEKGEWTFKLTATVK